MRALSFAQSLAMSLALAVITLPAGAQIPGSTDVSYSADFTMETADGAFSGKLNVAPGKERREDFVAGGDTMISIRRDDLGKTWILMPSERIYMEMGAMGAGDETGAGSRAPSPEEYETQMTDEGREEVNGVMTNKSKVIMTGKDGSKMGGFWWMTDDGILVKMDVIALADGEKMRMKRELTNIVVGPQEDALFEIPEGYSSMMMGMGAQMLGIPDMGGTTEEPAAGSDADAAEEEPPKKKGFGFGALKDVLDAVK
jgi:hypothetical protein